VRLRTIVRASGIHMWDAEGNEYIDASCGPMVSCLGHGNERIIRAITSKALQLDYAFTLVARNRPNAMLAERLSLRAGPVFCNGAFSKRTTRHCRYRQGIRCGRYYPIGAMLAPAAKVDRLAKLGGFESVYSYNAGPIACAAAIAILDEIEECNLFDERFGAAALNSKPVYEDWLNAST